jgi:hypothetical protein
VKRKEAWERLRKRQEVIRGAFPFQVTGLIKDEKVRKK